MQKEVPFLLLFLSTSDGDYSNASLPLAAPDCSQSIAFDIPTHGEKMIIILHRKELLVLVFPSHNNTRFTPVLFASRELRVFTPSAGR